MYGRSNHSAFLYKLSGAADRADLQYLFHDASSLSYKISSIRYGNWHHMIVRIFLCKSDTHLPFFFRRTALSDPAGSFCLRHGKWPKSTPEFASTGSERRISWQRDLEMLDKRNGKNGSGDLVVLEFTNRRSKHLRPDNKWAINIFYLTNQPTCVKKVFW